VKKTRRPKKLKITMNNMNIYRIKVPEIFGTFFCPVLSKPRPSGGEADVSFLRYFLPDSRQVSQINNTFTFEYAAQLI